MDTQTIEQEAHALTVQAADVVVTDAESYESAGAFRVAISQYRARVKELFAPHKKAAHKLHADLCADEARHLAAPEAALKQVDAAMLTWKQAEERRIAAERRAAEAEAKRLAEEEALAAAELAADAGESELAEAILEQPIMVSPPPVQRAAPKVAGIAVRENWTADVIDLRALVVAVAAGKAPLTLIQANMPAIKAQARSLKGECKIPGVRVYPVQSMASRAR